MEFRIGDRVRYIGKGTPDKCIVTGEIYPIVGLREYDRERNYTINVDREGGIDRRCPPDKDLELVNITGCRSNCLNCKGKCDYWESE